MVARSIASSSVLASYGLPTISLMPAPRACSGVTALALPEASSTGNPGLTAVSYVANSTPDPPEHGEVE